MSKRHEATGLALSLRSRKAQKAVETLCSGKVTCKRMLAQIVGLSERQVVRIFARADVQQYILARTRQNLALAAPSAGARVGELMAQTDNKTVALDAARLVLGISNIRPPAASTAPGPATATVMVGVTIHNDQDAARYEAEMKERRARGEVTGKGYVIDLRNKPDLPPPPSLPPNSLVIHTRRRPKPEPPTIEGSVEDAS